MSGGMDALIAARWPDRWARANDPRLRNRSKARNNLRKCFRAAVAHDAFKAANPDARCSNCEHANANPTPGLSGLFCLLDSDFEGYQGTNPDNVCARWSATLAASVQS